MRFEIALKKTKALLDRFGRRFEIEYAMIGGLAVAAWGAIRATKDIDFLISLPEAGAENNLKKYLKKAGLHCQLRRGGPFDPVPLLVHLEVPVGTKEADRIPVQLIVATKVWEKDFLSSKAELNIAGTKIPVLKAEELVAIKLKAGSALDLYDATELLRILKKEKAIDIARLKRNAARIGVDKKLSRILGEI